MSDIPKNPFSPLQAAAISMFELFSSFIDAGFTEQQSLYLVSQSLRPRE